jgi:hypothetical protein
MYFLHVNLERASFTLTSVPISSVVWSMHKFTSLFVSFYVYQLFLPSLHVCFGSNNSTKPLINHIWISILCLMFFMLGYIYMFIPKIVKQVICICTLFLHCFALRWVEVPFLAIPGRLQGRRYARCLSHCCVLHRQRACRIWTPRIWRSARIVHGMQELAPNPYHPLFRRSFLTSRLIYFPLHMLESIL